MKNLLNLRNKTVYFDKYLFISISLLSIMGLVFLYSASQANTVVVLKQSIFVLFGLMLMFFLSQPDPDFYKSNSLIFFGISIVLIVLTLLIVRKRMAQKDGLILVFLLFNLLKL